MLLTETSEIPKVWFFWTCPGLILSNYTAKIIKKQPDISIYMTSRIVHSYFFRFRLIRREIRHFVFRIGSYETDKACRSDISLRVAAKTRTKPTAAPSTVYWTNMPLTMAADSIRFDIFVISSRDKPLHCSHGRYAHRWNWCLSLRRSKQTLELYRD